MGSDIEEKLRDLPDKYFILIAQLLAGHINDSDTFDAFNKPILKPSIRNIYWLFIIQYAVLALLGIVTNIAIIIYTMYNKLFKDITHAFIVNLAICHFIQCAIVLPITLMIMLIQNWIFGQFLCFFLPLLQDIPLHVAMLSHLLIAWDRMRWLSNPLRSRLPAFVCCCATWLTGMVIALPYPIYTIYLELGDYDPRLHGVGLCLVNLVDDMHEYMRGLFVIMYCGPIILLSYLYIRTAKELRPPDGPFAVMMFEHRADIRNRQRNSSTSSTDRPSGQANLSISYDICNAEIDIVREKRTQRNLGSMAASQVLCLCPLMILRLAKMVLIETYENSSHFDFTYLMFVWIAFLPTIIFPFIYASEILPSTEKERIRGYFRLSSRRFKKSNNSDDIVMKNQENDVANGKEVIISTSSIITTALANGTTIISSSNKKADKSKSYSSTSNQIQRSASNKSRNQKSENNNNNNNSSTQNNYLNHPSNLGAVKRLSDSINNSCSNITSSTYCNNGSIDFENASTISGCDNDSTTTTPIDKKWNNSAVNRKNSSDCSSLFTRNDSCSTLDRDMEAIDLLERERSMDIQDLIEHEKHNEIIRNNSLIPSSICANISGSGRKLPNIEKICKSPKPSEAFKYENIYDNSPSSQTSLDEQQVPTIPSSSYTNIVPSSYYKRSNRKSLYNLSGRTKRNNATATNDDIIGIGVGVGIGGVFCDRETNKMSVIDSRIRRSSGRTTSISSARSSTKSRDYDTSHSELDFRENIFADL